MNVIFLLSDSPTHGSQYHNEGEGVGDNLKDKIEKGTLEKIVKKYESINNLDVYCIYITNKTNKMYNVIKENLKRCYITDKIDHKMLFMTIKNSLLLSSKRNHGINIGKIVKDEE